MVSRLHFLGSLMIRSGMVLTIILGSVLPAAAPAPAQAPIQAESDLIDATLDIPDTPSVAEGSHPARLSTLRSTFTSDEPLGDGTRQVTITADPRYYQAGDGSWLPIDPRFTAEDDGFTNFTNALRLSIGKQVAIINLAHGSARAQWQPLELSLSSESGAQMSLAEVLDPKASASGELADDNQTVRYPQSWSDSRLIEEVTAKPGSVEQKLILQSAFDPPLSQGGEEGNASLNLIATLRLQPGMALYSDGALQQGTFTTAGSVDIHSDGKTMLTLAPVVAYEQANPSVSVNGKYRFSPIGEGTWRVEVQTPWDWLAASQRQYPVVLDPTMKILGPVTTAQICDNYPYSACPATGYVDPESGSKALFIGHGTTWGIIDALIRFDDLPSLPPGYVIQGADLLVAPEQVFLGTGGKVYSKNARLSQITSAWDPATVNYNSNRPSTAYPPLDEKALVFGTKPAIPVSATTFVTRYHIQSGPTGLVSDWLSGAQPNNGLMFYQYPDNNCLGCSDLLEIYTAPLWTKDDIHRLDPDNPFSLSASEASGLMLQITYAPPTLELDQTVYTGLPSFGEIFADTYHAYLPPASSSVWTAIAVKGLHQVQTDEGTIDEAAGNLRIAAGCEDPFAGSCQVKTSQGDFKGRPNFVLTRGNPASTDLEAWVYPPNPDTPANANLDEYAVDAVPSANLLGNPTLSPGTHITQTVVMSTSEIMQIYNLNLVGNSRVGVRVHAWTTDPATGFPWDMPYIDARLYKPASTGTKLVKDLDGLYIGGHNAPGSYEMGKTKVGASEGGSWALTLEYFGNVDPSIGEPPITYTMPVTMSVEMIFVACASDSIPTVTGCFKVSKPGVATPYMDVGNFRVYNEAGFSCPFTVCSTIIQPGPNASLPAIVWKDDWIGGPQDRWVAVADYPITFDTTTFPMYFIATGSTWLAYDPGSGVELLEVYNGVAVGHPDVYNTNDPNYARLTPLQTAIYPSPPLSASDSTNLHININVKEQLAEAAAPIERQIQVSPGSLTPFSFHLSWTVQAEGYTSMTNKYLTVVNIAPTVELASLTVVFGTAWDMDYSDIYMPNGRFTNLRGFPGYNGDGGAGARIAAPGTLGSNWKGVTTLLLPVGENLPDSDAGCTGDCLDVRAFSDTPSTPNRTWNLPDLNITGQAQTLFFNQPGELTVFSTDHPNSVDSVSVPSASERSRAR